MNKSILRLETIAGNANVFRTVIKNNHGRELFFSVQIEGDFCNILEYFYADRNQGKTGSQRYSSKPKKLKTLQFPTGKLLSIIAQDLDKDFYGVEFVTTELSELTLEEYIEAWYKSDSQAYRFLILVGEGEPKNGLPTRLRTRLKNKLHRSIYIELAYYKDGEGVVKQCCYYDRQYKREGVTITPPMLLKCFFPYTQEGIIELINSELCCDFNHILVTDNIDVDNNTTPVCGSVFRR